MQVEVLTPQAPLYQGEAEQVQVETSDRGSIGILDHHQPLFAQLTAGKILIKNGSNVQEFQSAGGFISVDSNIVRVLSD
ncbi:MAG: F0F1 ATP synthase subunit epsilon [Bifidobacteriaceae bacterium]|jgi:F-type H+-transporting ATPase subunit epsilon|nr:F0F1 ATP synthase subunit epsilon [Bifidobacteriaceae bacterium]